MLKFENRNAKRGFFQIPNVRYGLGTDPISIHTAAGLDKNEELLPNILKQKNAIKWKKEYSTHLIGKWHLGHCNETYLPMNR